MYAKVSLLQVKRKQLAYNAGSTRNALDDLQLYITTLHALTRIEK